MWYESNPLPSQQVKKANPGFNKLSIAQFITLHAAALSQEWLVRQYEFKP
jgi:hypothetical protein